MIRPDVEITVGHKNADVVGATGRAIQIAVDAAAAQGGGTVKIAAGEYLLSDSLHLRRNVAIMGVAGKTLLRRGPLVWTHLAIDADISETQATPTDISPWRTGMGVCFFDQQVQWVYPVVPYRVLAIKDGNLHLDRHITGVDYCAARGGLVANVFPMVLGGDVEGASAEGLVIDAAVEDKDRVLTGLGCHAVYIRRCPGVHLSRLIVRNSLADGITCADSSTNAVIEDCEVCDGFNYGIHPGSHSADCTIRRCNIHDNGSDGLYVCWGIRRGQFTDNTITHNGIRAFRSGICIGHKDTDCLIARNRITGNRKHGIAFRRKTEANGAHRATIRDNIIENNGSPADELKAIKTRIPAYESIGAGIGIEGITKDLVIEDNVIRETRSGSARTQRHGIVLEEGVTIASLKNNTLEGHPGDAIVDRTANGLQALPGSPVHLL